MSIPLLDEIPQTTCRIRAWLISKDIDELGHVALIGAERRLRHASLSSHPPAKVSDHGGGLRSGGDDLSDSPLAQIPQENTNARHDRSATIS
jgi:hypothetical protein